MNLEVYCDESRTELFYRKPTEPGQYVLIGGIWIKSEKRKGYKDHIRNIRDSFNLFGEFKWNRVSPSRLEFYRQIVQFFFKSEARFRVIVLPAEKMDAIQFHRADQELMFYKFYYQLIHHWIEPFNRYSIFLDLKTNRLHNRTKTLKEVLQNSNIDSEVANVQALPSEELDILQLADVLIGAVGYHFHGLRTSDAKNTIIYEIEEGIGHPIRATNRDEEKFNVFLFHPDEAW